MSPPNVHSTRNHITPRKGSLATAFNTPSKLLLRADGVCLRRDGGGRSGARREDKSPLREPPARPRRGEEGRRRDGVVFAQLLRERGRTRRAGRELRAF